MKTILSEKNKFMIRFDADEDILETLENFCKKEHLRSGFFSGIGSAKRIVLSYYDIDKKKYSSKEVNGKLEIVSLTGSIAKMDDKLIIHSHGIFADSNMKTLGGHIKKLIVSATCEIVLESFKSAMEREYSNRVGLNLLQ